MFLLTMMQLLACSIHGVTHMGLPTCQSICGRSTAIGNMHVLLPRGALAPVPRGIDLWVGSQLMRAT